MLIINAGAHKSGSTWVGGIIWRLPIEFTPPPPQAQQDKFDYLNGLAQKDVSCRNFYIKHHFSPATDKRNPADYRFLGGDNVYVVNILRDVRDVLASAYFHHRALHDMDDIKPFFERRARGIFNFYVKYNWFWLIEAQRKVACPVLNLSYESLKLNFDDEVARLIKFLRITKKLDFQKLQQKTSLAAMRSSDTKPWMKAFEEDGGSFFRKGEIGDYENHFSNDMIAEVSRWETDERFQAIEERRLAMIAAHGAPGGE